MNFSEVWINQIDRLDLEGKLVHPRGKETLEVPQSTIKVNTRAPVLVIPERKLNYKFMAAEAYWILSGDDKVKTIADYNPNIAQFSDDGERFFGAYGPKIISQFWYVLDALRRDKSTRQAGLTIWRECPPKTKDVPCTISIFFMIRDGYLNAHVFMRSSDVWLGVPYDVFNFSMLVHYICAHLNLRWNFEVEPGDLYLTAASSHLYRENWDAALQCLELYRTKNFHPTNKTPQHLFNTPSECMKTLFMLRDTNPGHPLRWWEVK